MMNADPLRNQARLEDEVRRLTEVNSGLVKSITDIRAENETLYSRLRSEGKRHIAEKDALRDEIQKLHDENTKLQDELRSRG